VSDVEWLTVSGEEGWVVFTRDKNIRLRSIERDALISARVAVFVFTGGNASGVETTEAILVALPKVDRFLKSNAPPFICRITATGQVESLLTITT
jgi:voltage-gated potassium channel Kch